jgi:serine/threonine-protein kinase
MPYAPGDLVDHFEIVAPIGEGAYAQIYKVLDRNTGRFAVLKAPRSRLLADPAIFARFQREAKIARILDHPGLVRSLDGGEHRSEPYLVLEYVDGENFRSYLHAVERPIPVATVLQWGRELASVISYLGEHGIVHRDLKPDNLILSTDGHLKVIDFGAAQLAGARRLTWRHLSQSLGTPDYMSPEQIQGNRGDNRSDVYAWGVMMYEILTGRVPFGGDDWLSAMAAHLTKHPGRLRDINPEVPASLEAVVLKAMRRYPEHRYQDAAQLVDDLDHLDALDVASFDLGAEPPMGGIGAIDSTKRLLRFALTVAAICIVVGAVVVLIAVRA